MRFLPRPNLLFLLAAAGLAAGVGGQEPRQLVMIVANCLPCTRRPSGRYLTILHLAAPTTARNGSRPAAATAVMPWSR